MIYPATNPPTPWDISQHHGTVMIDHRYNKAYFQPDSMLDRAANMTGKTVITAGIGAAAFFLITAALNS